MIGHCDNCEFWDAREYPKNSETVQLGKCRRHSPILVNGSSRELAIAFLAIPGKPETLDLSENVERAVWPVTRDWDGCGEFQPKNTSENNNFIDFKTLFSTRTCTALNRGWDESIYPPVNVPIRSLKELAARSADELLEIKGFGPISLKEVREVLKANGLFLRREYPLDVREQTE